MPAIKTTLINSNPQEISAEDWNNICLDIFDIIVENSPVDTGQFQAAWEIYSISDDIYEIVNDLEYASFLEDGWSEQAPSGIIEPAIRELPSIIASYLGRKPRGNVTITIDVPDYVPNS